MVYRSRTKSLVGFGGKLHYGNKGDRVSTMFEFDLETNTYSLMQPRDIASSMPEARTEHTLTYIHGANANEERLIVCGGFTDTSIKKHGFLDSVYMYKFCDNTWYLQQSMPKKLSGHCAVLVPVNNPNTTTYSSSYASSSTSPCASSASALLPQHQAPPSLTSHQLYIFMGSDKQLYRNNMFVFNLNDATWETVAYSPTSNTIPPGRHSAGAVYLPQYHALCMYGGYYFTNKNYEYFNDLHLFLIDTKQWIQIDLGSNSVMISSSSFSFAVINQYQTTQLHCTSSEGNNNSDDDDDSSSSSNSSTSSSSDNNNEIVIIGGETYSKSQKMESYLERTIFIKIQQKIQQVQQLQQLEESSHMINNMTTLLDFDNSNELINNNSVSNNSSTNDLDFDNFLNDNGNSTSQPDATTLVIQYQQQQIQILQNQVQQILQQQQQIQESLVALNKTILHLQKK